MSRRLALVVAAALVGLVVVATPRPAAAQIFSGPDITGLQPTQVVPGIGNQLVKVIGTNFSSAATLTITPTTGITFTSEYISSTEYDLRVTVAANAPRDPRDVTITQGLFGSTDTCTGCMTVGPDITSVTGLLPNSGASGNFTVTGHAFEPGSTVSLTRSGYGYNAAETDAQDATNVVVSADGTTITATATTLARTPGRWKVRVHKGSGSASFGDGVTTGLLLSGNQPTLASITPAHIAATASNAQFTLVGSGYARGMTATVSGSGITQSAAVSLDGPDPTHKATLRLTSNNAAVSVRDVVLRNADNQFSNNTQVLGVPTDPAPIDDPTVTTVSPSAVGLGASQVALKVTGTNFGPGPSPTVALTPADPKVMVESTRDSNTQLTLRVTTALDAAVGGRNVVVTVGTKTVTKNNAFTVSTTPTVTSVTPPGRPHGYTGTFVVNGAGFSGTPTVTMTPNTGITINGVTVDSPAKLTVQVAVANDAPFTPARDVTVSGAGTCSGCFPVGRVPNLGSIAPNTGNGGQPATATVTGAFFNSPAVTLERTGQNSVAMIMDPVSTATTASGTFDLANAAPGKWNVRVTNIDGGTATLTDAYTVVFAAPSFPDPPPDLGTVQQNTPGTTLHLTGSSFAPGMTVTIPNAGGVTVGDVTRTGPQAADVVVKASDTAVLGSRDVKVTNSDGQFAICQSCFVVVQGNQKQFFGNGFPAYDNTFQGGAFAAAGRLGGPGTPTDVITGANAGGGPHVRAFIISANTGVASEIASFFAYGAGFTGGVRVAAGDLNGDGTDEIITGAGPGGGPHVKVFHVANDRTLTEPFGGGFFAYNGAFAGGVWVATGDVNGDGKADIITGAGSGGGPHVRAFTLTTGGAFQEIASFMAYNEAFAGGVTVAAGNMVLEGSEDPVLDEIATTPSVAGGPHVRVFSRAGAVLREFFAFSTSDDNGYRVAVGDFDFDTIDDFAISRGSSKGIFVGHAKASSPFFEPLAIPNPEPFAGGANVGAGDVDNDGDADLVVVPDHANTATVLLMRPLSTTA